MMTIEVCCRLKHLSKKKHNCLIILYCELIFIAVNKVLICAAYFFMDIELYEQNIYYYNEVFVTALDDAVK